MSNVFRFCCVGSVLLALFSCGEPEEHPVKPMGTIRSISANGPVTFKFVQGAGRTKAISTSMSDAMYNGSNGTLSVNGIGTMTIALGGYTFLSCNACAVENREPIITDTLALTIHGGSAKLNELFVTSYLQLNAQNTGTYKFSGTAPFFNVSCINLASVEAYNLITDSTYVNTTCAIDTEVHATKVVNVFINSAGSVNYKGNPPIVRATITGSGKLVKK